MGVSSFFVDLFLKSASPPSFGPILVALLPPVFFFCTRDLSRLALVRSAIEQVRLGSFVLFFPSPLMRSVRFSLTPFHPVQFSSLDQRPELTPPIFSRPQDLCSPLFFGSSIHKVCGAPFLSRSTSISCSTSFLAVNFNLNGKPCGSLP